jgi:hypothetical protein
MWERQYFFEETGVGRGKGRGGGVGLLVSLVSVFIIATDLIKLHIKKQLKVTYVQRILKHHRKKGKMSHSYTQNTFPGSKTRRRLLPFDMSIDGLQHLATFCENDNLHFLLGSYKILCPNVFILTE